MADRTASEGDWLVARVQDHGRGRHGRRWEGAEGNFFGSTVVEIRSGDPPAPSLSLAAGLALIEAVDAAVPGHALMLKWPNDLMLAGAKLAGILLERAGDRVVVGFGVNLAVAPAVEGRAVADLGGAIGPEDFAPLLAARMEAMLGVWRTTAPARFASAWMERAHRIGTALTVHDNGGERLSGRFAGLAADGALLLELAGGEVRAVHAGDITLR